MNRLFGDGRGNRSENRGRKLRTRLFISRETAMILRDVVNAVQRPGGAQIDEDMLIEQLIQQHAQTLGVIKTPIEITPQVIQFSPPVAEAPADLPKPVSEETIISEAVAATVAEKMIVDDGLDLSLLGDFQPSRFQRAIYAYLLRQLAQQEGDALINAVAGSGKTTTILHAAKLIEAQKKSWMFVAFNTRIKDEINTKLHDAGMKKLAKTAHSLGKICMIKRYGKLLKPDRDDLKYTKIARNYTAAIIRPETKPDASFCHHTITDLANMARLTLTNPRDLTALREMADHYSISLVPELPTADESKEKSVERQREETRLEEAVLTAVAPVISEGVRAVEQAGVYDFTDMLYIPYVEGLKPFTTDVVLVDECQDLSAAQLDLVLKCRKPETGKMIFVGDVRQAIYGFAGASSDSFWRIQERTGAQLLPLSICYRCPASHVRVAQEIVPEIEARPNAPEGIVTTIYENALPEQLRTQLGEALIICRLTAPLIELCIKLIKERINARVFGRDIGKQLLALIDAAASVPGFQYKKLNHWLDIYQDGQVERLRQREGTEGQIQSLEDRVSAIRVCFESSNATSIEAFKAEIADLFSDDKPAIWLSTIHKAKGLEEKNIYLLKPDKVPLSWPKQQAWEAEQEKNLLYVAVTRATEALYYVMDGGGSADEKEEAETETPAPPVAPAPTPPYDGHGDTLDDVEDFEDFLLKGSYE